MADVNFIVDGKTLTAPAGTLLIDACRKAGIEIPAFCYYPGLSLQAACRMCVVRQEKVPKLQTACTTQVAEGQVFITESAEIAQARKSTIELLLGNHPLDCPVCDAGGECELQDMTFKYGAGESLYAEAKQHREEQQWSPAVYYDRPRCILCYRCVRMCGEGMDVWALGIQNRGVSAVIAPNEGDQLDCEQCGMCIDVCPVGALTSGSYRYKTRPWEMNHVSTVCTHCADGCKVSLGVRQVNDGSEIVRADNRDKSGMNGDFLCAKGRFGFDFVNSSERLRQPLVRNADGTLEPATWEHALRIVASKFQDVKATQGGNAIAVIGSNRATNEENYLLQKFARTVLGTNNIDHARTADYVRFAQALAGNPGSAAGLQDCATAPAILLVGGNPTDEHPLLAWNLRTNVRLNGARLYVVNHREIKLERQASSTFRVEPGGYAQLPALLDQSGQADQVRQAFADRLRAESALVLIIASDVNGTALDSLLAWGIARGNVRFALLGEQVNSRGAADMGLFPDMLPGYVPVTTPGVFAAEYPGLPVEPGLDLAAIFAGVGNGHVKALLISGADPVGALSVDAATLTGSFVVVLDSFMTATAALADVVLPAASLYEKSGTVTNTFGDVQMVRKAVDRAGIKPEFEILVRIAGDMGMDVKKLVPVSIGSVTSDLGQTRGVQAGEADRHAVWLTANHLEPKLSPFDPLAVLDEIERLVVGYKLDRMNLFGGNAVASDPTLIPASALAPTPQSGVWPSVAGLFRSAELSEHSANLVELATYQEGFKVNDAAD